MLAVSPSPPPRLPLLTLTHLCAFPLLPPRRRGLSRLRSHRSGTPLVLLRARAVRHAGIVIDIDEMVENEDRDLPVDVSFTRRLPPALTFGDGLDALLRAANEVKDTPPAGARSGVIRFEVRCGYHQYCILL
jgi:isochorismate synthase / 2-succinyl-5-enolpyruvyl-6-hydroxy-3-cyclohexene-1-carboxylate synthase / 2-succinyl-6-hydroxy-2,4-cyclohexadiene-1-carboxylate synthase / o-succinylbenzoate synthase